jgi:hypothetical protein
MFKITDDDYQYYKKVLNALIRYNMSLMQTTLVNPYSLGELLDTWEKKSKSLARRGVKEGLRDMLTVFQVELTSDMKIGLNNQLISQGLPSFNQLVSTIKDIPQKVLREAKSKTWMNIT